MAHSKERRAEAGERVQTGDDRQPQFVLCLEGQILTELPLLLDVKTTDNGGGDRATDDLTEHCELKRERDGELMTEDRERGSGGQMISNDELILN